MKILKYVCIYEGCLESIQPYEKYEIRDAYDENGYSYGQLVIGSFIVTMRPPMHHVLCRVFGKTSNHPADSCPDLVPCDLWLFPKLKSPLKKRFQTVIEIQKNRRGSWWWFQQRILQIVLNTGREAVRTVCGPNTLKNKGASQCHRRTFLV